MASARRPKSSRGKITWQTGARAAARPARRVLHRTAATSGRRPRLLLSSLSASCAHRIQSLFNSLGDEVKGATIGLGGDGRYWNKQATQIILKIAAAAGVKKVW